MVDFTAPPGPNQWDVGQGDQDTDYFNAGTGENDVPATGGITHNWSNPGNIVLNNTSYAQIVSSGGAPYVLPYLRASNYGFNIPGTATILGIEVAVGWQSNVGSAYTEDEVNVAWGASAANLSTDNNADLGTVGSSEQIYGGPTDLWGELSSTLTPTVLNSSDFGLVLKVGRSSGTFGRTVQVDYIQIKVYYSDTAADGAMFTTQAYAEVIATRVEPMLVTQAYAEVIAARVAPLLVTQVYAEVINKIATPPSVPAGRRPLVVVSN